MRTALVCCLIVFAAGALPAQNLHIYAIDVEGGKSTLYVSPSGESMLIDTGYAGNNNRDAERIVAAAKAAGITRIDYLVITHYHGDHAGGVPQLTAKMPVGTIYDRGDRFDDSNEKTEAVFGPYQRTREKYPHQVLKPGDTIPINKGIAGRGCRSRRKFHFQTLAWRRSNQPVVFELQAVAARSWRKRKIDRHDHYFRPATDLGSRRSFLEQGV
jgi:metal-dependent hydrolase (beta-lactamase superfamily II)